MNQRALERDALPHAAREARHGIVGAVRRAPRAASAASAAARASRRAVETGEEREVLARGQLRVEKQVVAEDADRAPAAPRLLRSPCGVRRTGCRRCSHAAAWRAPRASSTCPHR